MAAPAGGIVNGFALAGTGLGDGLVGWSQGGQIAAVIVDAPPDPFAAQTPTGYVRTPPVVRWDMPPHAIGGVSFAVTIDDDTVAENLRATQLPLRRRDLDDGVGVLQVIATDAGGQETTSRPAELKVDTTRPRVRVQRFRNRLVQVTVSDPVSGVDATSVKVSWGDGKRSGGRRTAAHRYGGAGPYRVTVSATRQGRKPRRREGRSGHECAVATPRRSGALRALSRRVFPRATRLARSPVALAAAAPLVARADVPPGATIASASLELREQGDERRRAGISADGRFVVSRPARATSSAPSS